MIILVSNEKYFHRHLEITGYKDDADTTCGSYLKQHWHCITSHLLIIKLNQVIILLTLQIFLGEIDQMKDFPLTLNLLNFLNGIIYLPFLELSIIIL